MYNSKYIQGEYVLGNPLSDTILVTGWSNVKLIQNKVDIQKFNIIGNLYSTSVGITSLIRSLYINPSIKTVILLSLTSYDENLKSCECFFDFHQHGVLWKESLNKWKINSSIEGYIDSEIPLEDLNTLRESINCYLLYDLNRLNQLLDLR